MKIIKQAAINDKVNIIQTDTNLFMLGGKESDELEKQIFTWSEVCEIMLFIEINNNKVP